MRCDLPMLSVLFGVGLGLEASDVVAPGRETGVVVVRMHDDPFVVSRVEGFLIVV